MFHCAGLTSRSQLRAKHLGEDSTLVTMRGQRDALHAARQRAVHAFNVAIARTVARTRFASVNESTAEQASLLGRRWPPV